MNKFMNKMALAAIGGVILGGAAAAGVTAVLLTGDEDEPGLEQLNPASIDSRPRPTGLLPGQELQETADFWTPERLGEAQPLPLPTRPGKQEDRQSLIPPRQAAPGGSGDDVTPGGIDGRLPADQSRATRPSAVAPIRSGGTAPPNAQSLLPQSRIAAAPKQLTPIRGYPYSRYQARLSTYQMPGRTLGRLFLTFGNKGYWCSGAVVNTPNKSVVWTAGHCVYDLATKRWANRVVFLPGYKYGEHPRYGVWPATAWFAPIGYTKQANWGYDMAAVVLAPSTAGKGISDVLGGHGIWWGKISGTQRLSFGYPAEAPFTGELLFACLAAERAGDPFERRQHRPLAQGIGCDMTGGSSGGPWLIDLQIARGWGYIVSENSYGYSDKKTRKVIPIMLGPTFGAAAQNLYNTAGNYRG